MRPIITLVLIGFADWNTEWLRKSPFPDTFACLVAYINGTPRIPRLCVCFYVKSINRPMIERYDSIPTVNYIRYLSDISVFKMQYNE